MAASEHALQVAVAHMLAIVLDPHLTWWSAIDHGAGKLSKRAAGMMKARGVKRGLPDFMLLWIGLSPIGARIGNLVGIELKTESGTLSEAQAKTRLDWLSMGFTIYVARSLEQVQDILINCHVPMLRKMTFLGGANVRPLRSRAPRHRRARRAGRAKNHMPMVQRRQAQKE